MSSSRPSSRPSRRATCPTCAAKRVVRVTEDVVLRIGGRRHVVEAVRMSDARHAGSRSSVSKRADCSIVWWRDVGQVELTEGSIYPGGSV